MKSYELYLLFVMYENVSRCNTFFLKGSCGVRSRGSVTIYNVAKRDIGMQVTTGYRSEPRLD